MKAFKIHLIFLATLGFLLFQCTEQSTNPPEGPVTPSQGQLSFNLDMTNAPSDVVALQGKLFKEGQDTIVFDFEITDSLATALVNDIPAGIWTIQVDAFNSDSVIIYTGQTDVNVIPGQITPVYLHLNPTTGGLEIVVTWGGNKAGHSFLTFAQNLVDSTWRILLVNQMGEIEDLCEGKYPTWINGERTKFIYLAQSHELWQYNLKTRSKSFISYLDHAVNFLKYSKSLNKLLCDYHEAPNYHIWNLGYMNLDGSKFTTILADSFSEKYPVTQMHDRWIYFHSNSTGNRQIFRILPDGSNIEQITFDDASCEFPAFSFDGHKMVYTKYIPGRYAAIIIRNMKNGNEIELNLSAKGRPIYPAFSKDSKTIVFVMIQGENIADREIFSIKTDGSDFKQITSDPHYNYYTRPMF